MDISEFNRNAWNLQSLEGCRWSTPFSREKFEQARKGKWQVNLTPNRPVPRDWFPRYPDLSGIDLLALACGGGQQVPIFAASGARVTSFDNSDIQLQKDEVACAENGLKISAIHGDMADLSELTDESFDLIFNPVSNVFCENLDPIWKECHRVLRPGGRLLCGFINPAFFLFDHYEAETTGSLRVCYPLPYSDLDSLDHKVLEDHLEAQVCLEFSHSWEDQIGGQCRNGFAITGFFEDDWDDQSSVVNRWMKIYAACRAVKLTT